MKTLYRGSIFETNSSATHSMIILSEDNYKKWEENELYAYEGDYKLYTFDEAFAELSKNSFYAKYDKVVDRYNIDKALSSYGFYKCDDWFNDEYLEAESSDYTTEHGDKIVVCCRYGYDG